MDHNAQRIKDQYNPERDLAVGQDGHFLNVTWAERALLGMIECLEARMEVLEQGRATSKVDCRGADFRGVKGATITGTVINSG